MSILDTRKVGCKKEAIHKSLELNGLIARRSTAAEHWDGDNSRRSGSFRPVARVTRISAMNLAGGPNETNAEPVHVVPIQCGSLTRLLITIVATDNEPNREKKWSALAGNINLRLSETMRREYSWMWRGAGLAHATYRSSRRYSLALSFSLSRTFFIRRVFRLCFSVKTCFQSAAFSRPKNRRRSIFRRADKEYLWLAACILVRKMLAPSCVYRWWEKNRRNPLTRRWCIDSTYRLPGKIFQALFTAKSETSSNWIFA